MALNALLRLEGLSCALVGMRRPEYVADSLGALDLEPVNSISILTAFGRMNSQNPVPDQ
jgi:aryl-alcohol dehydrogenase-like predicted oxidoreductase